MLQLFVEWQTFQKQSCAILVDYWKCWPNIHLTGDQYGLSERCIIIVTNMNIIIHCS